MIRRRGAGPLFAALLIAACAKAPQPGATSFDLPAELTEVSGLAVAGPDSVFTHNDEFAIIHEIRLKDGKALRVFALGDPTIEGDFEGIAVAGGKVFLVTSDGLIYAADPVETRKRAPYRAYDSGIGPRCEIEGLSQSPNPDELLLLCKRLRNGSEQARLEIHRWHIGKDRAEDAPWISIPLETLFDEQELPEFRPSALEWDPARKRVMVVSARNRTLLVFDAQGALVERRKLNGRRHPRTEGIAIMPDGRMVLADEGSNRRAGRLAVYASNGQVAGDATP